MKILEVLLAHEKPLSTKELVSICNISTRMIQYNLEKLKNSNPPLVKCSSNLNDLRNKRYTINLDLSEKVNNIRDTSFLKYGPFNRYNM